MLKIKKFTGVNNVLPEERLVPDKLGRAALTAATNVDINNDGQVQRREGRTLARAGCHHNLFEADGFLLATNANGDLVSIVGTTETVLLPAMGQDRIWYAQLSDGRVAFSNGMINGIASATGVSNWGVPIPSNAGGAMTPIAGGLPAGNYRVHTTYVRTTDGRESGPYYGAPFDLAADSGIMLTGLPVQAGYGINVYLTNGNGEQGYLAGQALGAMFTFTGTPNDLALPCRTDFLSPAPVGILCAVWHSRSLVAVGNTLYASKPGMWEHFDLRRDWKTFDANITTVVPLQDGIYVGTDSGLLHLKGGEWDKLEFNRVVDGRTVLGSGVAVRGEQILRGDGPGQDDAMICIADRQLVAGFNDGSVARLTQGMYETNVQEVAATFRVRDGIPQYVALPIA